MQTMKMRSILSFLAVMMITQFINAQVIEIVGTGAFNNPTTELYFSDIDNIDYIVVEAVYKSPDPVDGPVEFVSGSETISANAVPVEYLYTMNGTDYGVNPGYFRATMQPAPSITLNTLNNVAGVHSFVAYVYRTDPDAGYYSEISEDHAFYYRNGDDNQGIFNIPIGTSDDVRDVTTTAVISELAYDTRLCVITVEAGDHSESITLTEPNSGANLALSPITLEDVAGDVDNVQVSIYSPYPYGTGDSFISGNIVVDVEQEVDICLTNPPTVDLGENQTVYYGFGPWEAATITANTSGGVPPYTYLWSNGETTETICVSPTTTTDYSVQVTDANGCTTTGVANVEVIDVRCGWGNHRVEVCHTSFFCPDIQYTVCVRPFLAYILLCLGDELGSCDYYKSTPLLAEIPEFETEEALREFDRKFYEEEYLNENVGSLTNEMNIYPNPVNNIANVVFSTESNNTTTIELYNMMGKKVRTLFSEQTVAGYDYQVTFDANSLSGGIYLLVLNDGEQTIKQKVTVK